MIYCILASIAILLVCLLCQIAYRLNDRWFMRRALAIYRKSGNGPTIARPTETRQPMNELIEKALADVAEFEVTKVPRAEIEKIFGLRLDSSIPMSIAPKGKYILKLVPSSDPFDNGPGERYYPDAWKIVPTGWTLDVKRDRNGKPIISRRWRLRRWLSRFFGLGLGIAKSRSDHPK